MSPSRLSPPELAETLAEALCRVVGRGHENELLCRALGAQFLLDALTAHPEARTLEDLLAALEPKSLAGGGIVRRIFGALQGIAAISPNLAIDEFVRRFQEREGQGRRRIG